ncbi:MAG TPA: elongation factor P [Candidatus Sulfotelmatobacter sp.]|jgi:elongation factor P|nr:elongation factor P [Candidatus Sulfotelmatobacter sp.]
MKANEMRKGMVLRVDGQVYRVLEATHRTPGNLRAFVQAKIRNVRSGLQTEQRFRSEDDVERVYIDTKQMQYLYHDAEGYHFMDTESYEQFALSDDVLGDTMSFVVPESMVTMDWFEGTPVGVEVPSAVDLKIVETAPGIKGATASAQKKPATLETGLVVQVPSFINEGEVIRVSTESGEYLGRAGA